jgi:hypothetical protein
MNEPPLTVRRTPSAAGKGRTPSSGVTAALFDNDEAILLWRQQRLCRNCPTMELDGRTSELFDDEKQAFFEEQEDEARRHHDAWLRWLWRRRPR